MKRVLKTLSVILLVMVLTGCVKQTVHMDITNSEVTIKVTDAMDSSLRTEEDLPEIKAEYEALGFKVADYDGTEDGMIGVVLTKTFKLDDVSSSDPVEFHLETLGTEKLDNPKLFQKDGNVYKAKMVFDTSASDVDGYSQEELESYASSFEIAYSVTLPSEAKSHNADVVDGKTYTWNITYGERAEINYEFEATGSSILIYVVVGVVVLVLVVVVLLVLKNKKGTSAPSTPVNNQVPPMPTMNNMPEQSVTPVVDNTPTMPTEPGVYVEDNQQVVVPAEPVEQPNNQNPNMQ